MRMVWLVLLVLLAGCANPTLPDTSSPATQVQGTTWHAFTAQYELVDQEAGATWLLDLELGQPQTIADQDLQPTLAYPLRMAFHAPEMRFEERTFWLDGTRLVREDHFCGFYFGENGEGCGDRRIVRWDLQGGLPPFGIGWPQLVGEGTETFFLGLPQETRLVKRDGWLGLADGVEVPYALYLNHSNTYRYDGGWVPTAMRFHAAFSTADQVWEGRRVALQVGEPLAPIDGWTLADGQRDGRAAPPLFTAAATAQVFGIGITYQDAFDGWLALRPDAKATLDSGGCVVQVQALPLIGDSPLPDNVDVLAYEGVSFKAYLADATGNITWWSWDYSRPLADLPAPANILQPNGFSASDPHPFEGLRIPCVTEYGFDLTDPQSVLQQAWILPLDSGLPCGFHYKRARAGNVYDHATGPVTFTAILSDAVTDNKPLSPMSWGLYYVTQDAQTGAWSEVHLLESDMARLDAGGWEPRPLPTEELPALRPTTRCVVPSPTN